MKTAKEILSGTPFDVVAAKQLFCDTLIKTGRNGTLNVWEWLRDSSFFDDPASTNYHGSEVHGLVKHSMAVCQRMLEMHKAIDPTMKSYSRESIIITALLHDVCKVGVYTSTTRNVQDDQGRWSKVPYYKFEDPYHLGHGAKSVILLLQHGLTLTTDEIKSITAHSGGWESDNRIVGGCWKDNPLGVALHMADLAATYIDEL